MAKKRKAVKPIKKTTDEVIEAISKAMSFGTYYFTDHGDKRSKTREKVSDLEIIKILESNDKWHEAKKDKYDKGSTDWNYHIRGKNTNGDQIRIAISFDKDGMPIITVINLDEAENE